MKKIKLALVSVLLMVTTQYSPHLFAADFSFKDINGKRHQLSDYKGKWVLVNYWATFCGPCKIEVSHLNKIKRAYGNKVDVIGLEAGSSSDAKIREFMNQYGMRFTVAPTQLSTAKQPLGAVPKLPTTFIVDPQGKVVKTHTGILTESQIRPYLASSKSSAVVAKKPAPQPAPKQEESKAAVKVAEQKVEKQAPVKQEKPEPAPVAVKKSQPAPVVVKKPEPAKPAVVKVEAKVAPQPAPVAAAPAPAPKPQPAAKPKPAPKSNAHDFLMSIDLNNL